MDQKEFKINGDTTLEEIIKFLKKFPKKHELSFFDHFQNNVCESGDYVTVQKLRNGSFAYYLDNYGLTYQWTAISQNELAQYIFKNRKHITESFQLIPFSESTKPAMLKKRTITHFFGKVVAYLKFIFILINISIVSITSAQTTAPNVNIQPVSITDIIVNSKTDTSSITPTHTIFLFDSLQQAKDSSRISGKPLMVYFTADWCLPCKEMKKYTFHEVFLSEYLNQNYVTCIQDATNFIVMDLAESMNVKSYPCIIFYNKNGIEKKRVIGFQSPEKLLEIAKSIAD